MWFLKYLHIKTYHIHIEGIVQGVGFRPFIYQLALAHRLNGWVKNSTDGVHIEITANAVEVNSFIEEILDNSP